MTQNPARANIDLIARRILIVRNRKVMIGADLADLYGVSTRALNQAVKRNADRFPDDFVFRLTEAEKREVVTKCDHLARLRFSSSLPFALTAIDADSGAFRPVDRIYGRHREKTQGLTA